MMQHFTILQKILISVKLNRQKDINLGPWTPTLGIFSSSQQRASCVKPVCIQLHP